MTSKKRTTLVKPAIKLNDDESEPEDRKPSPKVRKEVERVRSRSPQHKRRVSTPPRSRRPLSRRQRRRSLSPPRRVIRRGRRSPSPPPRRRRRRSHSVSPPPRRRTRSPVEVLKRSVADSTISDDQLPQYGTNDVSPMLDFNLGGSPKRVPLDVRINQVLGLEKQVAVSATPTPPPPLPRPNYYNYQQYKPPKVVQVGNMIQIVPTEECLTIPYTQQQQQQTQQILQVGNMLQIVPSEIPAPEPPEQPSPIVEDPIQQQKQQKAQERERKRKEKERKRKEREKKKQQKLKMRTERMIKRALLLEIEEEGGGGGGEEMENQENVNGPWPPVPIVLNNQALKPAGKGILLSRGLR